MLDDLPFPWLLAILAVIVGAAAALSIVPQHANETIQTCTVSEKDRTRDSDGNSDARIYTEDCGVLQVADLWARGQHNAADVYAAIEPGHTYELTTVGWRIGWMSKFPVVLGTPLEVTAQ